MSPAIVANPMMRLKRNIFQKCFLPADHMADVLDLPSTRACLAMPIAPALKYDPTNERTTIMPRKRINMGRKSCQSIPANNPSITSASSKSSK